MVFRWDWEQTNPREGQAGRDSSDAVERLGVSD